MRRLTARQMWIALAVIAGGVSTWFVVDRVIHDARHEFRADLLGKLDALHDLLTQLRPGNVMREEEISATFKGSDGNLKGARSTMKLPLSFAICGRTTSIVERFSRVPHSLLQEASRDPNGFTTWGGMLKADFKVRATTISNEIARIREQYRKDPNAFSNSFTTSVGETKEGDFYFSSGDFSGCMVDRALKLDLDAWLANVSRTAVQITAPPKP